MLFSDAAGLHVYNAPEDTVLWAGRCRLLDSPFRDDLPKETGQQDNSPECNQQLKQEFRVHDEGLPRGRLI
jgi:hypothetical protein